MARLLPDREGTVFADASVAASHPTIRLKPLQAPPADTPAP